MAAKKTCLVKLKKEISNFIKDPPPYIPFFNVNESNILEWHFVIEGPPDTDYHNGWYIVKLKFPADYPFKPPSIMMVTPSGRFKTGTRLCLTMSDYHPETWNPMWSVASVLTGLLSFMLEETPTQGSITTSAEEKKRIAEESGRAILSKPMFNAMFPDLEKAIIAKQARTSTGSVPEGAQSLPSSSEGSNSAPVDPTVLPTSPEERNLQSNGQNASQSSKELDSTTQELAAIKLAEESVPGFEEASSAAAEEKFALAIRLCKKALERGASEAHGCQLAVKWYLKLGCTDEAVRMAENAALAWEGQTLPEWILKLYNAVSAVAGQLETAKALLACDVDGARGLESGSDPESAAAVLDNLLKDDCSHSPQARFLKAVSLSRVGNFEAAIDLLETCLQLASKLNNEPFSVECCDLGKVLHFMTNVKIANSRRNLAMTSFRQQQHLKSLKLLDMALVSVPKCSQLLHMKGLCLSRLERNEEAVEYFSKAIHVQKNMISAMKMKAECLKKMGQHWDALSEYNAILLVVPSDVNIRKLANDCIADCTDRQL